MARYLVLLVVGFAFGVPGVAMATPDADGGPIRMDAERAPPMLAVGDFLGIVLVALTALAALGVWAHVAIKGRAAARTGVPSADEEEAELVAAALVRETRQASG